MSSVRIAVPEPSSLDAEYNQRALPPYLKALQSVKATPVVIPATASQEAVASLLADVQGILLPGSKYDVDPQIYGEEPIPQCAPPDPARAAVDELLLQDGFNLHKPILAICYGAQTLNVWRNGSLFQDLDAQVGNQVNHRPGRTVHNAHRVQIKQGTKLAGIVPALGSREPWVNSSHHQAIRTPGDNLIVSAVSERDHVIEAVELDSDDHFVLGIQWHPERTFAVSSLSDAIFSVFAAAASSWRPRQIEESVAG